MRDFHTCHAVAEDVGDVSLRSRPTLVYKRLAVVLVSTATSAASWQMLCTFACIIEMVMAPFVLARVWNWVVVCVDACVTRRKLQTPGNPEEHKS